MTPADQRIYLASRSPRRRELLKQIGVDYDMLLMREDPRRNRDVDETPIADEMPDAYVLRIARIKAEAGWRHVVARKLPARPVLSADTSVVLAGEIIGKPEDAEHARQLLARLSGRTHQVLTAVAIARHDVIETALSTSEVEFRDLTDAEIRRYMGSGEPLDKAGAYAVQGQAAVFVRAISGSYSGIMGLPLYETAELLRRFGIEWN